MREIVLHRPYEAHKESNTDTEELFGFHGRLKRYILCFELKTVKSRREVEYQKLYIGADVNASWEKVKLMCLYSTETAFTQHKHDKYSVQTKAQKPKDKNNFERHVNLQAHSETIRGTRDGTTTPIG